MSNERTTRYHVQRREFLNQNPGAAAFIIAIVEDTREIADENENDWKWGTIQLDLADCYRRIEFDFDMSTAEARANSLRKIELIAEVINEVREAIALEVESRNARPHVLCLTEVVVA